MVFERNPKFYGELKQTNEDVLKVIEKFHKKSPYFDYTDTFRDYIKQIEELKNKFPVTGVQNDQEQTENKTPFSASKSQTTFQSGNNNSFNNDSAIKNNNTSPINNTTTTLPAFTPATQQPNLFFIPNSQNNEPSSTATATATEGEGGGGEEAEEESAPPQPNVEKFEEPDSQYQVRCKLYERLTGEPKISSSHTLLGCGSLFVKQLDSPTKLHLIVRQDPDLRKVLLNQIITSTIPIRQLAKAIQLYVPGEGGKMKIYVVKVKDDKIATELYELLNSVNGKA